MALSIGSGSNVPIARTNKHVVLAMSPARPKVSSMQAKLDHTKIDTSLYEQVNAELRPKSVQVVESARFWQSKLKRNPTVPENSCGSIHVTVNYEPNAGILTVRLVEANDLQPRDFSGTADPYAKIRLLPDRANFWQTKIHKKTLNPGIYRRPLTTSDRIINSIARFPLEIPDSVRRRLCVRGKAGCHRPKDD